jgi:hypothetical protein
MRTMAIARSRLAIEGRDDFRDPSAGRLAGRPGGERSWRCRSRRGGWRRLGFAGRGGRLGPEGSEQPQKHDQRGRQDEHCECPERQRPKLVHHIPPQTARFLFLVCRTSPRSACRPSDPSATADIPFGRERLNSVGGKGGSRASTSPHSHCRRSMHGCQSSVWMISPWRRPLRYSSRWCPHQNEADR